MDKQVQIVDNTAQFGEKSVLKLMIQYAIPSIVAMLVQATYNTINMSFVGRSVGPIGIAAIAICAPITMIQGAINQLVGNGCAAAIAIRLGQGDKESSRSILGTAVTFVMLIAVVNVVFAQIFIEPLLLAFGASDAILPYAKDYLTIILLGMLVGYAMPLNPMMRIEGYPKRAMFSMLLSTIVNLICSPTFIFVFKLGIRGAALGTFCAHVATATWVFAFLIGKNRTIGLKWKYCRLRLRNMAVILQLGLPTFLMQFTQSMLSFTMNKSLGTYGGDMSISAWGITNNINNLVQQPVLGLTQGAQPIIGYNIGAKNYARVKAALLSSLGLATLLSFLCWLMTRLFPAQIFAFFNDDPELIAIGTRMILTFRMLIFVTGFQQAGAAYFQYSGKPRTSVLLTLSRQVLILIPCILILPRFFGMNGLLYSGPISDMTSTLLAAGFILFEFRRLTKLIHDEDNKSKGVPDEVS